MKRLITKIAVLFVMAVFATTALAAGSFAGKITRIDGTKVTVTAEQDIPGWVKKGTTVSALGGSTKVLEVKGKEMVLRFGSEKAAKIKADTAVTVTESAGDELQGC
jgi:protein-disulfide isomerase